MKIHIKPRKFFENLKGTSQEIGVMSTYNVISINTCEYKPKNIIKEDPPFSECVLKSEDLQPLILYFHDYDKPQKDVILMSENDVKKIINFLKSKDLSKPLIVHCTAGISRSGAIGIVLNEVYNKNNKSDFDYFNIVNKKIRPNKYILELMRNVLKKERL